MHRSAYVVAPLTAVALLLPVPLLLGATYPMVLPHAWHRLLHIVGAVLFLGNIVVSAFWSLFALRSGDPVRIRFAMAVVNWSDAAFTAPGVLLLMGNGLVLSGPWGGPTGASWIGWGLAILAGVAVVWIASVVPDQHRLLRMAGAEGGLPPGFSRVARRWTLVGGASALLPFLALGLMVLKT